jgi:hypothetical protein
MSQPILILLFLVLLILFLLIIVIVIVIGFEIGMRSVTRRSLSQQPIDISRCLPQSNLTLRF